MALVLAIAAIALFAVAAVTDACSRRIPNPVSIALAALGLRAHRRGTGRRRGRADRAASISWRRSASSPSAALAFRFRLLGGGDAKLLAAGTLWLGAAALGPYLLVTVLAGGLMAVAFVTWHWRSRPSAPRRVGPACPMRWRSPPAAS